MKSATAGPLHHRQARAHKPDMSATSSDMSAWRVRLSVFAFGHDHFGIEAVAAGPLMKITGAGL